MFSADVHIELPFIRILYRVNWSSLILWVNNVFLVPRAIRAPPTMGLCRCIIIVKKIPITRRGCLGYDYVHFRLHCFNPPGRPRLGGFRFFSAGLDHVAASPVCHGQNLPASPAKFKLRHYLGGGTRKERLTCNPTCVRGFRGIKKPEPQTVLAVGWQLRLPFFAIRGGWLLVVSNGIGGILPQPWGLSRGICSYPAKQ